MDLGSLVARNARVIPDKEGVIYENSRYPWKEVNEKVNAVSNTLIKKGLKKGDKVAMWMFNTDNFVFAFYGIVKAGGVAVPVNFRLAPPEAEYIFDHCDTVAIVFDDIFEPSVRQMDGLNGGRNEGHRSLHTRPNPRDCRSIHLAG